MGLLSIITPTMGSRAHLLSETAESLAGLTLPSGWTIEWVLQEDGDMPSLGNHPALGLGMDVRYAATGGQHGSAVTRNLALARSRGQLLMVLDDDDLLAADAFVRAHTAMAQDGVAWVAAQAEDLLPDGTRTAPPTPGIPAGRVLRGQVLDTADAAHGQFPFLCGGMLVRTNLAWRAGGWPAAGRGEDIGFVAALSELADGWLLDTPTMAYRKHADQSTRTSDAGAAATYAFISRRARALSR